MATTRKRTNATVRNHRQRQPSANGATTGGDSASVFFEAVSESADVLFTTTKAATDRAYRLSNAFIHDMQSTQRDLLRLGQTWAAAPLDLLGWYTCLVETAINAQGRAAEGARRWWTELAAARKETQEAASRSFRANWRAGRAGLGLAWQVAGRATRSGPSA